LCPLAEVNDISKILLRANTYLYNNFWQARLMFLTQGLMRSCISPNLREV